jgi:hypothetical protein
MRRRWDALAVVALALACTPRRAPSCETNPPADACTRVLFVGNSYTSVNDLPATFARVAESIGRPVHAEMIAPGGATLADHAASTALIAKIREGHWNYVVLQEQSQIPSIEQSRQFTMYPSTRLLVEEIRRAGARPVLYATWARRDGWPENGLPTYAAMQEQLTLGYQTIGDELHAIIAPVGTAWADVVTGHPEIPLWQQDGSHPTVEGTYLAANVIVAALFHQTPGGSGARGMVPEPRAILLQNAAAAAVPGTRLAPAR